MKRDFTFITLFACMALLFSCKNDEVTYEDKRNEESALLNRFIDENKFKVLNEFPKDNIFQEKEFVLLKNGVYLHIIDPGDDNRPVSGAGISSVAQGQIFINGTINTFDGFRPDEDWAEWPLIFKYGNGSFTDDYFLGEGYASALKHVGDNSSVSMIIPFVSGSSYQKRELVPIYFSRIDFTFE